jgi:hypothetical protein
MLQMTASRVGQDFTQILQQALPTASDAPTVKFLLLEPARAAIALQVMIVLPERNLVTQERIAMVAQMVASHVQRVTDVLEEPTHSNASQALINLKYLVPIVLIVKLENIKMNLAKVRVRIVHRDIFAPSVP